MKISAIAALCTAPLALAGTLEMDLRNRGVLGERNDLVLGKSEKSSSDKSNNEKDNSQGNNNNQISNIETTSSTEVIIIWVNPGADAATTTVNSAAMAAASTVGAVAAATHTVVVGGATKVYTPDTIEAAVGDVVIFEFQANNHSVTQSNFATPCIKNGGMDSGFVPNTNGTTNPPPQVAMTVNVTTPIWFYCRQTGHCGEGMTFSINPTANKTQADFQALAIQQNGTGTTAGIVATAPPGSATSLVSVATSVAPPPSASSSVSSSSGSSSSGSSGLTTGTGTVNSDGSCTCAVICAAGSIPNPAAQGVNAFGGMAASIPASAMEITA